MRKYLQCVAVALLVAVAANAQTKNITLHGRVVEKDTKEAVIQATAQLLSLPDSTYAAGAATVSDGSFTLPRVAAGNYVLKVSFIGYKNFYRNMQLTSANQDVNVGDIQLETDAIALREAVVTAEAPQVQVVEDTLVFNSSAYRIPEGSMLEELVKKLPGAEIDDEGNVKINGKEVKKIMVNGEEFFGGDVKTGLKNLPVNMVENLKTYDKQSDLARVTGIQDGDEETVLDLTVKKNMNQGWFGNADLAAGNHDRYLGRVMLNRFRNQTQVSLIGSANNVNDQGFSGGGFGGPMFRRNNGLTATKTLGMSFATKTDKLEIGGSARYNYVGNDVISTGNTENFLTNGNSYSNSNSMAKNKNYSFNADMRLEWKPDSLTNIIFRPNFSYTRTNNLSTSESGTFSADPYDIVENPNLYLNMDMDDASDPLLSIRRNLISNGTQTKTNSWSANGTLQLNRRLNQSGRNITFRGRFNFGDNDNDQYTESLTRYYLLQSAFGGDSTLVRNQYITTPTNSHSFSGQLTYSEPIARAVYLQFSYQLTYGYNESDKRTYDLQDFPWQLRDPLPQNYETSLVDSLGKYAEYKYWNHEASVSLRIVREKYQLSVGASLQPQHTILSYKRGDYMIDTTRNVLNFAPNVDLRVNFSKISRLRLTYRGRSSMPSMENMLPITDNSNPMNIRVGNPGLKPAFTHSMNMFFNTYNADKQQSIMASAFFNATQNSISNSRVYNELTGGWTTTPKNINGNWNVNAMFGFNTALKDKRFTINTMSQFGYQNNVAYLTDTQTHVEDKNTTTNMTLGERISSAFRNNWFEFGLNGSINYSVEKDKLTKANNQEPYTFAYGANTSVTLPWSMTLTTNITNQSRRGYTDHSMNRDELVWNAQISQPLFKGAATLSFEMYDILKKQSNITRSLTANGRSAYRYNGINSYCMVHFIYRLNIFGGRDARRGQQGVPGMGMPPGERPNGGGGRPPMGGGPGGGGPGRMR